MFLAHRGAAGDLLRQQHVPPHITTLDSCAYLFSLQCGFGAQVGIRDLLQQQDVPAHVDYFSLDAEGQVCIRQTSTMAHECFDDH